MKLDIEGFPHCSQDAESISCAETTLWAVMEYFSNRYADYSPALPSLIHKKLSEISVVRTLPTTGVTPSDISYTLKQFGFGTYIYGIDSDKPDLNLSIENIIRLYTESGIPVIAIISNEKVVHSIVIIGRANVYEFNQTSTRPRELHYKSGELVTYYDFSDIPDKYVVQDDNLTPYKSISLNTPSEHYIDEDDDFNNCVIDSIVVPLHKKIYLEAYKARELILHVLGNDAWGYKLEPETILRFFLTSSRSFKAHISSIDTLKEKIKDELVLAHMPKFIWCCEMSLTKHIASGEVYGLIIMDATAAINYNIEALIFAGYPGKYIYKLGDEFGTEEISFELYTSFKGNLR